MTAAAPTAAVAVASRSHASHAAAHVAVVEPTPGAAHRVPLIAAGLVALACSIALWAISLNGIDIRALGQSGLAGIAPWTWYASLAALVAGVLVLVSRPRPSWVLVAAFIGGVVVVLYGTMPAIAHEPLYAWTYKHVGVTHLIMSTGAVHPSVDVYNRWPGMFALVAALSRVTGVDPLFFARWTEPAATLIDALLVAAIARAITRDRRVAAMSSLVFILANWIGQDYFSPQAVAYPLYLALMLVVVKQLWGTGKLGQRVMKLVERVVRRPQPPEKLADPAPWGRGVAVTIVLTLSAAIAVTHQLTPYMLVMQVGVLTILGLRPRLLIIAITAITIGYLVPNFGYIESHYGLLNGLNPFDNAQVRANTLAHPPWFYGHAGGLLSYLSMLLAALAAVRLLRAGHGYRVVPLGALALAPFALLLVSNYGGEGSLRVYLFSTPWKSILLAWGLCSLGKRYRLPVSLAVSAAMCCLFMFSFAGYKASNVIPSGEVHASEYFYSHAPRGSLLTYASDSFPTNVSARYAQMSQVTDAPIPALDQPAFAHGGSPADLGRLAHALLLHSPHVFMAFATSEEAYAVNSGIVSAGVYREFAREVAQSPLFRLWYSGPDAQLYELTTPTPGATQ